MRDSVKGVVGVRLMKRLLDDFVEFVGRRVAIVNYKKLSRMGPVERRQFLSYPMDRFNRMLLFPVIAILFSVSMSIVSIFLSAPYNIFAALCFTLVLGFCAFFRLADYTEERLATRTRLMVDFAKATRRKNGKFFAARAFIELMAVIVAIGAFTLLYVVIWFRVWQGMI
ncbi:MAG: hypothetical protein AAAFM81_04535 [Pseudomonadota bacterium]